MWLPAIRILDGTSPVPESTAGIKRLRKHVAVVVVVVVVIVIAESQNLK
jgi:hypothetical protein